ncbi:MAG: hypothetical protein CSA20_09595 [Deltaproteobacteria bacterium]|nr:MAG: hypothetical protein CSA20_09595 [Deltaproteobacteria bacterium]
MKNKMTDLNDHLFAQLERLADEDLDQETLAKEITRSEALCKVSTQIIENANLVFKVQKATWERDLPKTELPKMLES